MFFDPLTGDNPLKLIRKWRDLWNNSIRHELRRLKINAGFGIKVEHTTAGIVISALPRSGNRRTGGSDTATLFKVTLEEKKLTVSMGYVNRNGLEVIEFKGSTIDAQTGTLCICTEPIDKAGKWSDISLKFITPNPCAYPIAKITCQGEEVTIEQYPVTVAMIFRSKRCPIAKM